MRNFERKRMVVILMAVLLLVLMPGSTVLANTDSYDSAATAYGSASEAFWEKMEAYNGKWDDDTQTQTQKGAYDNYMDALESGADNVDTLYQTALTARQECESAYSALQTAYTALETAYDSLTDNEKSQTPDSGDETREAQKSGYDEDYGYAQDGIADLADLVSPDDYASQAEFWSAVNAYYEAQQSFWDCITAYYGDDDTAGSYGSYMDALYSGASNAQELYETAGADRAAVVSAWTELVSCYEAVTAAYETLSDSGLADDDMQGELTSLGSDYTDAADTYNELATLVAPEDFVPDLGELSSIWIDANGNFGGVASAPAYWKVNESGKLVAATADDWTLKYEKTSSGVTLTLRNFVFISTATDGETELDAIWSDTSLTLNLEGTNSITGTLGSAIGVEGNLTVNGPGTLALYSTATQAVSADGETYVPLALYVSGTLTNNGATITVSSNNTENAAWTGAVVNTGSIVAADGQRINVNGTVYTELKASTETYTAATVTVTGETQTVSPQTGENSAAAAAAGAAVVIGVAVAVMEAFRKKQTWN